MNKKLAIIQSNYIPWKGYFDIINMADEFVLYDHVQFTKNDWRNRNKIKTHSGANWLTIPIISHFGQKISETIVCNDIWRLKHWKSIIQNYNKSKYFVAYKNDFYELYFKGIPKNSINSSFNMDKAGDEAVKKNVFRGTLNSKENYLSDINYQFIALVNKILGIKTKITREYHVDPTKNESEAIVYLCKQFQANEYISGPSAKNYLDETLFLEENIKITWMDYTGYPEYNQLFPPFEHAVSIIDLIFNEGPDAGKYLKSFKKQVYH